MGLKSFFGAIKKIPAKLNDWYLVHSMEYKAIPDELASSYTQYVKKDGKIKVTFADKVSFTDKDKQARTYEFNDNIEETEQLLNADKENFVMRYDNDSYRTALKKKAKIFSGLSLLSAVAAGLAFTFALPAAGIATSLLTLFNYKMSHDCTNDLDKLDKAKYFMENREELNKCAIYKNNTKFALQKSNKYYKIVYKALGNDNELNINNIRRIGISKLKALKKEYEMLERIKRTYGNELINDVPTEEEPEKDIRLLLSRRH
jgi:hypothetical protein